VCLICREYLWFGTVELRIRIFQSSAQINGERERELRVPLKKNEMNA
jgi:hypothetical protein